MLTRNALLGLGLFAFCFASLSMGGCQGSEVDPNEAKKIAEQPAKNPDAAQAPEETVDSPKNIKRPPLLNK